MIHRVAFAPEAVDQLEALYSYIAAQASQAIAGRYTSGIVDYCESLEAFPERGTKRDDIRPGLRITHYRKRTVIAFAVDADAVSIIGVFYGWPNWAMSSNWGQPSCAAPSRRCSRRMKMAPWRPSPCAR